VFDVLESFRLASTLWATSTSWPASTSARTETGLTTLFHRRTPPAPGRRPTRFVLRRVLSLTPGCERVPGPPTRPPRTTSRRLARATPRSRFDSLKRP
jgi:hypothetical protein